VGLLLGDRWHVSRNPPKGTTKARKAMPLFKEKGGENE
jgi:hypothetical protein